MTRAEAILKWVIPAIRNTWNERKCKEILKALELEPFINKPCASKDVCEHDKNVALDKIRAEIEEQVLESLSDGGDDWFVAEKVNECLEIIDKYKAESEDKE